MKASGDLQDDPPQRATPLASPRLWALLPKHLGDARMVEALAGASGLAWVSKRLKFNPAGALPNIRRAGSLFTLAAAAQAELAAPWPDVVISAGKRSVPVALWIKAASGGRAQLVHLGRPNAPLSWFDLIVTTPQYGLPARPNVLVQSFPLTAPAPTGGPVRDDLKVLPRPRLTAILGGDAPPQALDADAARRFATDALARTRVAGGSLMVATSPRTPKDAVAALRAALAQADAPLRLSVFGEGADDYRAFLAAADAFLVTDDSASMATEAALTGAPVALFTLPRRPGLWLRAFGAVERAAARTVAGRTLFETIVSWGLVRSNRDIDRFFRALDADGLLVGGPRAAARAAAELADAAARVRALADAGAR